MGVNAVTGFGMSPLDWREHPSVSLEKEIQISQTSLEFQKTLPATRDSSSKRVESRTDAAAYKRFCRSPDKGGFSVQLSCKVSAWAEVVSDKELHLYAKYVRSSYQLLIKEVGVEHRDEDRAECWIHIEDNFSLLLSNIKAKQSSP